MQIFLTLTTSSVMFLKGKCYRRGTKKDIRAHKLIFTTILNKFLDCQSHNQPCSVKFCYGQLKILGNIFLAAKDNTG